MNNPLLVPVFRPNASDDIHCFEACVAMILETVDPVNKRTLEELALIAGKKKGGWTWPMRLMVWLVEQDFEVINEDAFDYVAFAKEGIGYLERTFGKEVADVQVKYADISAEQQAVPAFMMHVRPKMMIPTTERIRTFLQKGYFIICTLNHRTLTGASGYVGHAVLVYGMSKQGFLIHDPGLPPMPSEQIPIDAFEKAWAFPNAEAKNIFAIKYHGQART